jgi:hypothetical protein
MITTLFSVQYIIIALLINIIVFGLTDTYKVLFTSGEGENPKQGLPKIVIRNIMMTIVFLLSFGLTWLLVFYDQVKLISSSVFITSSWCAIMSTLTYNIGIKEVMMMIKNKFKKIMGSGELLNDHTSRHRRHRHKEDKYIDTDEYYD